MFEKLSTAKLRMFMFTFLGVILLGFALVPSGAQAQTKSDPAVNAGEHEPGLLGKNPDQYNLWELYDPNSSVWEANPTPPGYRRVPDSSVTGFARWMRYFPMRAPKEPLITWTGAFISGPSVMGGVLDFIATSVGYTSRGSLYHIMKEYVRSVERELEMYVLATSGDSVTVYGYLTGSYSRNAQRTEVF
ncbi:MAG TPA: hypothetical protein VLB27_07935, partial [candidate division Zixibacteria bacterium]|nr:hypothetical protein [candidate division Zixibacteria bacterium]